MPHSSEGGAETRKKMLFKEREKLWFERGMNGWSNGLQELKTVDHLLSRGREGFSECCVYGGGGGMESDRLNLVYKKHTHYLRLL